MRRNSMICLVALILAMVMVTIPVYAAEQRTTPVCVMNLLGIDPNNNTVRAEQGGLWSVGITSMPTVNVNPHAVTQSGTWNVGFASTPSVNVGNTPTVAISGSSNTVKTPTQGQAVFGWFTNDYNLSNNAGVSWISTAVDCSGYKELRFVVLSSSSSPNLKVDVYFKVGTISKKIGEANFGPNTSITSQAGFTVNSGVCAFTIPVMGDHFYASITNYSGSTVTIYKNSWVYMVN